MHWRRRAGRDETGQAGVELVGVLPVVALLCALVWQLALAGHAAWAVSSAARAAARASAASCGVAQTMVSGSNAATAFATPAYCSFASASAGPQSSRRHGQPMYVRSCGAHSGGIARPWAAGVGCGAMSAGTLPAPGPPADTAARSAPAGSGSAPPASPPR